MQRKIVESLYPVELFLIHWAEWAEKHSPLVALEFPDGSKHPIGGLDQTQAAVFQTRLMLLKHGANALHEPHWGKVFHMARIFITGHAEALDAAGWFIVNDGLRAVAKGALLRAVHGYFSVDPVPEPDVFALGVILRDAKKMANPDVL